MKLSEFPKGTVIQTERKGGLYVLSDTLAISDDNKYEIKREDLDALAERTPIGIVSVPWGVTVQLVKMLQDAYGQNDAEGNPITFDTILSDAVEEEKTFQQSLVDKK